MPFLRIPAGWVFVSEVDQAFTAFSLDPDLMHSCFLQPELISVFFRQALLACIEEQLKFHRLPLDIVSLICDYVFEPDELSLNLKVVHDSFGLDVHELLALSLGSDVNPVDLAVSLFSLCSRALSREAHLIQSVSDLPEVFVQTTVLKIPMDVYISLTTDAVDTRFDVVKDIVPPKVVSSEECDTLEVFMLLEKQSENHMVPSPNPCLFKCILHITRNSVSFKKQKILEIKIPG